MMERLMILMHYGNTAFDYHSEFNKYKKVQDAILKDDFEYLFDARSKNYRLAK